MDNNNGTSNDTSGFSSYFRRKNRFYYK